MKLKPCPFCGGEAEMIKDWRNQRGRWTDSYRIRCARCPIEDIYWHVSEVAAIKKWNTRAERRCKLKKSSWDNGECTWGVVCSACGYKHEHESGICWKYCPSCGAKVVE